MASSNAKSILFNTKRKTNMNKQNPISEIVADIPSAPAKRVMPVDKDKQMSQMKAIIKRMQLQIERFWSATDPKRRRKLMQVHVRTLKESLVRMRCMSA